MFVFDVKLVDLCLLRVVMRKVALAFVDGTELCPFLISTPAVLQLTFCHRDRKTSKACSESRL